MKVAESSLKALSLRPSMHLDAALFRAVSSSVCFPCGSNKNISIISRSFITRSPYWHLLTTVASCVQHKQLSDPGSVSPPNDNKTAVSIFMQGSKTVFRFMKWSDKHMRRSLNEWVVVWSGNERPVRPLISGHQWWEWNWGNRKTLLITRQIQNRHIMSQHYVGTH